MKIIEFCSWCKKHLFHFVIERGVLMCEVCGRVDGYGRNV